MHFDKCIQLCNHYASQGIEQLHQPLNSPLPFVASLFPHYLFLETTDPFAS